MSLHWAILGSGSKANSYLFQTSEASLCIDAGYPLRTFHKRAERAGLAPYRIDTLFLTHTHGDHVKGLAPLLETTGATLVHRRGLQLASFLRKPFSSLQVDTEASYQSSGIDFFPFGLHHDAPFSTSYHFQIDQTRFTLITDTGKTDSFMLRLAARSDVLFLESNYCPDLLEKGPYPAVLKQRVSSDQGHLSNDQAVDFLNSLALARERNPTSVRIRSVYLVHLSATNNSTERVREILNRNCHWPGRIRVCARDELVIGDQT